MQTEQQRLAEKALALKLANQEARPLSLSEILDLLKRANEENHLRILSFGEIVEILGCSKKHFHTAIKHQLPVVMISSRMRGVRQSDFEKWLESKTREVS